MLQTTAHQTQASILTFLETSQAAGKVQNVQSFWIFNGLAVTADADTLLALAARPDVHLIRQDRWRQWVDPLAISEDQHLTNSDDVAWNISWVQADLAWSALGLSGEGVTVAIMDTGVDWLHQAIRAQYRGYKENGLALHQGNWVCTTDEGYLYPVDGHGHGTHVAGTAVGGQDDMGQAMGMAPGAQWIGVKTLNNDGYGFDSWIHAAFEWVLAPAGDPALAPQIVNGSWGSPFSADEAFRPDLQALRAAGIVSIFAMGNEGPREKSLGRPASYPEAIAVGASDDLDQVADFSGRGPSPWDEIKPEIVAPGVQIRSSLPGGTYGTAKGTSMAAPHVAGLAALLLEADPSLTIDEIEEIMTSTAVPLTTETPNNNSGWGRIDAYQAASVALEAGFVLGQITRHPDQQALPTAQVTVLDHFGEKRAEVQVDQMGDYHVALLPGTYTFQIDAFGYAPRTIPDVVVQTGATYIVDATLSPLPTGVVWGQIRDVETDGPVGATISVMDTPAHTTSDPQTGQYSLALPAGTYTLQVTQNGYRRHITSGIEIVTGAATRVDITLTPAPTLLLVDSGQWYYGSQIGYFEQALDDRNYVYDTWQIRDTIVDRPELGDLDAYEITIWSSPLDSPGMIGAGDVISGYLSGGGNLLLTGQDVGFWDDGLSGWLWHPYFGQFLKAEALADNAGLQDISGQPGEFLDGITLSMNGEQSAGNQQTPDLVALLSPRGAAVIGRYADGGVAAIEASGCQSYQAVYLAAGLEGLGDRAGRSEVMHRVLTWLDTPSPPVGAELYPPRQEKVWLTGTSITYTLELRNTGQVADHVTFKLSPSAWGASVWDEDFEQELTQSISLGACQTQTVGLEISVPPDITWNTGDVVTLTARSQADPQISAQASFFSKAPAPILLVDAHRWYDTADRYRAALEASELPYDEWRLDPTPLPGLNSPSLQRLQRYPVVIWFTAYDWADTLTVEDEERLATYLDDGGRLLFSSQDYLYTNGFTDFAHHYLGVGGYTEGMTATQVTGALGSPIAVGPEPMSLSYPFLNWSDALKPTESAFQAYWGQQGQPAALTTMSPGVGAEAPPADSPAASRMEQTSWKTAFFAFPLEALAPQDMAKALKETVNWLSPLGDSSLAVDRATIATNGQLTYVLTIQNTGPALLSSVTLSNTVPPSTTYVADSLEGPAIYDPATDRFTWSGNLAPGQAITSRYRLQVAPSLPDGTVVRNVAHLRDDSRLALDRVAVSRVNAPDLSKSIKVVNHENALSGQTLTYTITIQNQGLRPAQAHLVDPMPPHADYLPGSARASTGQLTITAEALQWSGPIAMGQAVSITFSAQIEPTIRARYIWNRATVSDGWPGQVPLEAHTWIQTRVVLPLIFKR